MTVFGDMEPVPDLCDQRHELSAPAVWLDAIGQWARLILSGSGFAHDLIILDEADRWR